MALFDKVRAGKTLEDLNKEWKDCTKCPLRLQDSDGNPTTKVCPGLGTSKARVMIIGQSPTKGEGETGIMMQDRGGQDIRSWLANVASAWGMGEKDLYFTNCVKCPAVIKTDFNKEIAFIDPKTGDLKHSVIPARECGPYLEDEITILDPELIITLGPKAHARIASNDTTKRIPSKHDSARRKLLVYQGRRYVTIGMPTRLNQENEELEEDKQFLEQVFLSSEERAKRNAAMPALQIPTWEAIFKEVGECTKCDLHKCAKQKVFGDGNLQANIMIVGEAPGKKEDEFGMPFVGQSGNLLRQTLAEIGVDEKEVYIANTVKCWPGDGNPDPTEEQAQACISFLQWQIKKVKPKVIIALGRISTKTLTREVMTMGRMRGQKKSCWFYRDCMVIPVWHPSYVLRNVNMKGRENSPALKEFKKDLTLAKELSR